MTIPNLIIETAQMLFKWGCDKLSGDEGFGVLMMSHHPDGQRMHNFCFETLEEAYEVAYQELEEKWKDATAFVLCYDVTISLTGGLQRGFLFEAEDRTSGGRYRFFHGTAQSGAGRWAPTGEFIELPEGKKA